MSKDIIMYTCSNCKINFKTRICPRCRRKGEAITEIPFERDFSEDSSYLNHILKKKKDEENK